VILTETNNMKHRKYYSMLMFLTFFAGMLSLTGCEEYDDSSSYTYLNEDFGNSNIQAVHLDEDPMNTVPVQYWGPQQQPQPRTCGTCYGQKRCIQCQGRGIQPNGNYCWQCQASGLCRWCCDIKQQLEICHICGGDGCCRICSYGDDCRGCNGSGKCMNCNGQGVKPRRRTY